ncbi:MAG: aldehyde ferredoxin oxidoreductase family protein [Anaerolineae bacterium]|nr:aldehyde ferredoxin oxidoreductase family protein [Anaerolineae bacterium]
MAFGTTGRILWVDLTQGTTYVETLDEATYRLYPGGKALGAYLLLRHLPANVDPLGPDNILVLASGLLTGAPFSTATRFSAIARSPLTGTYGESEAAGFWGPELKMAGWEAIVLTGRAPQPVWIHIRDDKVEIRDATHLWGHEPLEVQTAIRAETGDKVTRVLQIGIGGENLVRYAAITNDLRHYNGRNGMGAVMGSKLVKAIGVRGSGKWIQYAHDAQPVVELGRRLAKGVKEHPQSWDLQEKGTPGITSALNAAGILPTRNFHQGAFEGVDNIKWEAYEKELLTARKSCYACAVRCKREVRVDDRYQVSDQYGGPEYEAVSGFGSNCGVDDLQAIAKANELCNRYTLDAISTASVVAFAMECFEHGLIGLDDTDGVDLRFGHAEAMLQMVDMIAQRRGIGNLLAEGVKRAAQAIGGDAHFFAMHVKGQELPMHDPRGKFGVGLGYAVSENGADHLVAAHDPTLANAESVSFKGAMPLGIRVALPPRDSSRQKVVNYTIAENWNSAEKVIGLCFFGPAPRSYIQVEDVVMAVNAATGWGWGVNDILAVGERATNLARLFNAREGFGRADDRLPDRLFTPLENGALEGVALSRDDFERALTDVYDLKGWDTDTGVPTPQKLDSLGIGWAAEAADVT